MNMMLRLQAAMRTGLTLSFTVLTIAILLALAGAPMFFGMIIITASVMMTIYIYSVIGFLLGFCFKYFKMRPKDESKNSCN